MGFTATKEDRQVLTVEEISNLTREGGQPAETLMNVVALIARRFQTDVCSAYLLEPDRATLVLAATLGLRRECVGTLRMGRDWPKNVAVNPGVSLQIGDLQLEGEARLVTDEAERANIESQLASKYWAAWIGSWLGFKPQGVFEVKISGEAS